MNDSMPAVQVRAGFYEKYSMKGTFIGRGLPTCIGSRDTGSDLHFLSGYFRSIPSVSECLTEQGRNWVPSHV